MPRCATLPRLLILSLALFGLPALGCSGGTTETGNETETGGGGSDGGSGGDEHAGHDHAGHDHHAHGDTGPHDGHILETSDAHFHAEWTHTDEGKITVYILNSSAEADHPIEAESVEIEATVAGGEAKTYTLNAVGETPTAAFEVTDAALLAVLKVAGHEGATATLKFSAEGKDVTAEIKHEEHDHAH